MTTSSVPVTGPDQAPAGDLKRAVAFTGGTSVLVPLVGLLTQPILARALGATGRGELVAAITPLLLMTSLAALGLPGAITFLVARRPQATRRALVIAFAAFVAMGVPLTAVAWLAVPWLSGGSDHLASYMRLTLLFTVPYLWVSALRAAAAGAQQWRTIAVEALINAVVRTTCLVVMWRLGWLTPASAVALFTIVPAVSGMIYAPLLFRRPAPGPLPSSGELTRELFSFGSRVYVGSIAALVMSRTDQLLMTPLSSARDLGLFSVANTVSDVPFVLNGAVASAVNGVNSRTPNGLQVAKATRLCLLLTTVIAVVVGGSSVWWMVPLFGSEFTDAVVPTMILFGASILSVPGTVAASAMSAFGRPGLSSLGTIVTCVVNILLFVALVPPFGVYGACWAGVLGGTLLSAWMVVCASRVTGVPRRRFVAVELADVRSLWALGVSALRRVTSRRGRA